MAQPDDASGEEGGASGREALAEAYRSEADADVEDRLRKGEPAWQLIEAVPGGLVFLDTEGRVLFWDYDARDLLGWSEEDVLGEVAPFVSDEDREEFEESFEALLADESVPGWEISALKADGSTMPCEVWARRIDTPGGEAVGVAFVLLDIRRREEWRRRHQASQRRYRELLEHNIAGVFRSRRDGTLIECNDQLAKILGYSSAEELKDTDVASLYPSPAHRASYIAKLREEGNLANHRMQLVRRDGSPVWVLENSFLTWDPETENEEIVGSLIEVPPPSAGIQGA